MISLTSYGNIAAPLNLLSGTITPFGPSKCGLGYCDLYLKSVFNFPKLTLINIIKIYGPVLYIVRFYFEVDRP